MSTINFTKMQGCGNDFVVIDTRSLQNLRFSTEIIRRIADRRYGIGCDQLILIEDCDGADCFMRIFNSDGSEGGACGNGSRCLAKLLAHEKNKDQISIQTKTTKLAAKLQSNGLLTVDMERPNFSVQNLPLSWNVDPVQFNIEIDDVDIEVSAVDVGNVHLICIYESDISEINLSNLANRVKRLEIFSKEINISAINITRNAEDQKFVIKIRTYERGTGETPSCGTAACAATVVAIKRELIPHNSNVEVKSKGGSLFIEWPSDEEHMMMTGKANTSFTGQFNLPLEN